MYRAEEDYIYEPSPWDSMADGLQLEILE